MRSNICTSKDNSLSSASAGQRLTNTVISRRHRRQPSTIFLTDKNTPMAFPVSARYSGAASRLPSSRARTGAQRPKKRRSQMQEMKLERNARILIDRDTTVGSYINAILFVPNDADKIQNYSKKALPRQVCPLGCAKILYTIRH